MTRIIFEDDESWDAHLAEIEEAKARAWEEGLEAGRDRWLDARVFGDPPVNPYRKAEPLTGIEAEVHKSAAKFRALNFTDPDDAFPGSSHGDQRDNPIAKGYDRG